MTPRAAERRIQGLFRAGVLSRNPAGVACRGDAPEPPRRRARTATLATLGPAIDQARPRSPRQNSPARPAAARALPGRQAAARTRSLGRRQSLPCGEGRAPGSDGRQRGAAGLLRAPAAGRNARRSSVAGRARGRCFARRRPHRRNERGRGERRGEQLPAGGLAPARRGFGSQRFARPRGAAKRRPHARPAVPHRLADGLPATQ